MGPAVPLCRWTHGDWTRLAYADDPGEPARRPYADAFSKAEEPVLFYDRFWDRRSRMTRYATTGYHFIAVCSAKDSFTPFLREHFRRHYFQMGLIVHFQYTALLDLSHDISVAVEKHGAPGSEVALRKAMTDIRRRHLVFTHRYWFTGISNQVQGRELYERWRTALGLQALYDEVERELANATGFLDTRANERAAEAGVRLNVIAAIGLLLALALGVAGANVFKFNQVPLGTFGGWGALFVLSGGALAVGGFGLHILMNAGNMERALRALPLMLFCIGLLLLLIGAGCWPMEIYNKAAS